MKKTFEVKVKIILRNLRFAILPAAFCISFGLLLSGCSGFDDTMQNPHIMNNGCFITCYNNHGVKKPGLIGMPNAAAVTANYYGACSAKDCGTFSG